MRHFRTHTFASLAAYCAIPCTAIVILLLCTSCTVYEPLPGLCYTDKTGTYVCLKDCSQYEGVGWFICTDNNKEFKKWEECKQWTDSEIWAQCMIAKSSERIKLEV